MLSEQEIANEVRAELSETFRIPFGENGMNDDTNLIKANMLDSFGMVELVVFLESRFDIQLSDDELMSSKLTSVSGISGLVKSRLS